MKLNLRTFAAVAWAALIVGALGACSSKPEGAAGGEEHAPGGGDAPASESDLVVLSPEASASAGITTALVASRPFAAQLETTGEVGRNEDRLAHVGSRVSGRIAAVHATLGQSVRAGQALAVIDSTELGEAKADYLQSRAREELARANFERESRLAAEKISSQKEVLEARAALLEAEAARRNAEERLHLFGLGERQIARLNSGSGATLLSISAPFEGVVIEKDASLGEIVSPEQKLFTVADLRRVWIWVDVFEKDLGRVHLDDGAVVDVDAYPGETFGGRVSFLSAQVDPATRTVRARLDVDNADGRLRPGMFARVRLSDPHGAGGTGQSAVAVVVPERALQRQGEGFVVFVAESEGRFRRREVTTGRKAGGMVEILSGLRDGEAVVVEGVFFLASEAAKESFAEEE
jgi:membrane fusion protein, heavy metal efflux system